MTTSSLLGHDTLVTPKSVRLSMSAPRCAPSEYQTDPTLRHMTKATRRIGRNIPVSWQHGFRDGGGFRWLADSMVASLAIPFGSVTCPSAASDFVKLSRDFKQLRYGDHESQFIDVFLPDENHICDPALDATKPPKTKTTPKAQARGMIYFVHGGAVSTIRCIFLWRSTIDSIRLFDDLVILFLDGMSCHGH